MCNCLIHNRAKLESAIASTRLLLLHLSLAWNPVQCQVVWRPECEGERVDIERRVQELALILEDVALHYTVVLKITDHPLPVFWDAPKIKGSKIGLGEAHRLDVEIRNSKSRGGRGIPPPMRAS
nr:hypothetical protein Iba_chr07bCG9520 [Ipomoea batatas]